MVTPHLKRMTSAVALVLLALSTWYILGTFMWGEVWKTIAAADWIWIGIAGMMILFLWLVRSIRWMLLLRASRADIRFRDVYLASAVSLALAIVTPFQSGEAVKVESLKRLGLLERVSGYGTLLIERVLDLATVLVIAAAAVLMEFSLVRVADLLWLLAVSVLGAILLFCFRHQLRPARSKAALLGHEILLVMKDRRTTGMALFLTLVCWSAVAVGWYCSLRSVSVVIGIVQTLAMVALLTLFNLISCIPGAVGVSEMGSTELLLRMGVEPVHAQTGSLMLRLYGLLALIMGLAHWGVWVFYRSFPRRRIQ